ncbi:MAG: CotH kinase family protein [Tannerella sp.]|jgi:hypothetical protein|nr:CotH kinase family protein [Tannerella sp.]
MKTTLTVSLCVVFAMSLSAKLHINELMSNNVSALMDESKNYSMWVEVRNDSAIQENLNNYYFSDKLSEPKKWRTSHQIVPGGGYAIVWFERDEIARHASFKLEPEGGALYLFDKAGSLVDEVTYPQQYRNVSYGRIDDGDEWAFFVEHSAGTSNTGKQQASTPVCSLPMVSKFGGFYAEPVEVSFVNIPDGATVRYTLDASEPTLQSTVYEKGEVLKFTQTTVLRAVTFIDGKIPSQALTNTYFVGERNFTLPVVSIVTEQKNLTDSAIGIYVEGTGDVENWNQEWDRPANMELYDTCGASCLNQELDISIGGNYSRRYALKTLHISPRKKFGDNRLRYDLFAGKPGKKYKDIQLRNGGQDFARAMMRDAMMQTLIIEQMDIDYQAYEPAICFINGNYMGIANLRERHNKDYFYTNYGLDEDEFVYYKPGETSYEYNSMLSYLKDTSTPNDKIIGFLETQIDIEEYMNYVMTEMYISNWDWHFNYIIWKKNDGGVWRWLLYDTDQGFYLYKPNYIEDYVQCIYDPDYEKIMLPMRRIMENPELRQKFLNGFCVRLHTTFAPERVNVIIDSLAAKISDEIVYHKKLYNHDADFDKEIAKMKAFASERPYITMRHLSEHFMDSAALHTVSLSSNIETSSFTFNGENVPGNNASIRYFDGNMISVQASDVSDYTFKHWEITEIPYELTFIDYDSEWKYWDVPLLADNDWYSDSYDDKSWQQGISPFQYGYDNVTNKTTLIRYGDDKENKVPTAYFRKAFTISDLDKKRDFKVIVAADDGAAVYVNGTEIGRCNLPQGELTNETLAKRSQFTATVEFPVPYDLLREGENLIAAEVHQTSRSNGTLYFHLSLRCEQQAGSEEIQIVETPVYNETLSKSISLRAVYDNSSGLEAINAEPAPKIYPNPVTDEIIVENYSQTIDNVCIYDLSGRTVIRFDKSGSPLKIDVSTLPAGIYILKIADVSYKIVKK